MLITALRQAPRWLFLATLIYAPWAYGCTTAGTIAILNWLLAAVLGLWIISCIVVRRWPFVSRPFLILGAIILVLGWGTAINSGFAFDTEFESFIPFRKWIEAAPGSVDFANSVAMMYRVTLLLGVALFVVDLAQRPQWLLRIWWTVGVAGGSIAFFGLIQKATGAIMIFWQYAPPSARTPFFATYLYHANAGAFLNLVFLPTAGLAMRAILNGGPLPRAIWITNLIIVVVAIFSNTSRMAQLLSLLLAVVLLIVWGPKVFRAVAKIEKRWIFAGSVALLIAILSLAQAARLNEPIKRWTELGEHLPKSARWLAMSAALPAAADAKWFGFGPATFRSIFPEYQRAAKTDPGGNWRFLHQDYLQTVIEWGWIGAAALGFFLFGGMIYALQHWRIHAKDWLPRQSLLLPLILLSLASVAIHALVDFPFQIASLQLYVATYLGICWGSGGWGKKVEGKS